ncbi:MAG TPA: hypothetical protein VFZ65_04880 [Planctomycetota bacterium]|nr:hypothetical protein [Planctomycetota bacterium]
MTVVCLAALQQLQLTPIPGQVGEQSCVVAHKDGAPLPGLNLTMESPDGSRRVLGITDAEGCLRFVPQATGRYVLSTTVEQVVVMAPFTVIAAKPQWLLAFGSVPLGLALLWWNLSRARGRRGP